MSEKPSEKSKFAKAFGSTKTAEEMLDAFKEMEMQRSFIDLELGLASYTIAFIQHLKCHDPEKALPFASKALKAFTFTNLYNVTVLHLMGSIHIGLKRSVSSSQFKLYVLQFDSLLRYGVQAQQLNKKIFETICFHALKSF
ncbi:hypothetical protein RIF29_20084 [Crotalaria pallida]|uniref:Uncharacterized protein n=1 Tax=Crotalaria pallida TaxID=3830 RepID=A0AAN9F2T3_CROPI